MPDVIKAKKFEDDKLNKIKFTNERATWNIVKVEDKEILLNQHEIKLLKLLVSKPAIMHMLIDYPNAIIKDGLFDCAHKIIKYYGVSIDQLVSRKRDRHLINARRDFTHLAIRNTTCTRTKIGNFLKRHHTMIIHYLKDPPVNLDKICE